MFTSKQNPDIRSADRAMGVAVAAAMAEGGRRDGGGGGGTASGPFENHKGVLITDG
jgi:hypothetical protein